MYTQTMKTRRSALVWAILITIFGNLALHLICREFHGDMWIGSLIHYVLHLWRNNLPIWKVRRRKLYAYWRLLKHLVILWALFKMLHLRDDFSLLPKNTVVLTKWTKMREIALKKLRESPDDINLIRKVTSGNAARGRFAFVIFCCWHFSVGGGETRSWR